MESKNNKKNSFILHKDKLSVVQEMTDEQAGIFIKAIYQYQINSTLPTLDFGIKMAVLPFIHQFKNDNEQYQIICERNKNNGLNGGRPKNPVDSLETQKTQSVNLEPRKPDREILIDTDREILIDRNDIKEKNTKKEISTEHESIFESFWKKYPRHVSKKKSKDIFLKLIAQSKNPNSLLLEIKDGLDSFLNHIAAKQTKPEFIPHCTTWLNQERWKDDYATLTQNYNDHTIQRHTHASESDFKAITRGFEGEDEGLHTREEDDAENRIVGFTINKPSNLTGFDAWQDEEDRVNKVGKYANLI